MQSHILESNTIVDSLSLIHFLCLNLPLKLLCLLTKLGCKMQAYLLESLTILDENFYQTPPTSMYLQFLLPTFYSGAICKLLAGLLKSVGSHATV